MDFRLAEYLLFNLPLPHVCWLKIYTTKLIHMRFIFCIVFRNYIIKYFITINQVYPSLIPLSPGWVRPTSLPGIPWFVLEIWFQSDCQVPFQIWCNFIRNAFILIHFVILMLEFSLNIHNYYNCTNVRVK